MRKIDLVLFDLDGTLLDTAADLGGALNAILRRHNKSELPLSLLRRYVSKGGMALVCLGFGCHPQTIEAQALWHELLDYYHAHLCVETGYFEGMETLLESIEYSGRPWGVVTNKPGFLTLPLLRELGIDKRTRCIVSGNTLPEKKPSPAPLLYACQQLDVRPEKALYIGDDIRDIQAGNQAGMTTLAAAYGYILENDDPHSWGADGVIHHPEEIHEWIDPAIVSNPA